MKPTKEMIKAGKKHHDLKIWPEYFERVLDGTKTFEVRLNDRDFRDGDTVTLKEFEPSKDKYTGREASFTIGYVSGKLINGYVVFSLLKPAALKAQHGGWQPIESAPTTGESVLLYLYCPDKKCEGVTTGYWTEHNGGGWVYNGFLGIVTHWQPLPAPPGEAEQPQPTSEYKRGMLRGNVVLFDALNWVMHVINGTSKSGEVCSLSEFEEAMDNAMDVLKQYAPAAPAQTVEELIKSEINKLQAIRHRAIRQEAGE